MNKDQFIRYMADTFDLSEESSAAVIDLFTEGVYNALSDGHKIDIPHFGKFDTARIPERKITVPKSGKKVVVKEHYRPYFKPHKDLNSVCKVFLPVEKHIA